LATVGGLGVGITLLTVLSVLFVTVIVNVAVFPAKIHAGPIAMLAVKGLTDKVLQLALRDVAVFVLFCTFVTL
jgi:hypothetical protein